MKPQAVVGNAPEEWADDSFDMAPGTSEQGANPREDSRWAGRPQPRTGTVCCSKLSPRPEKCPKKRVGDERSGSSQAGKGGSDGGVRASGAVRRRGAGAG